MSDLYIMGDVYLDRPFRIDREFDRFVFNLEYPISAGGIPALNKVNLRQRQSYIEETFGNHPQAVCLANNHIFDFGREAFLDTIEFLEENNIAFFGAGTQENNFNNPWLYSCGSTTIAFLAYCSQETGCTPDSTGDYGVALLDFEKIVKDIEVAREQAGQVVCMLHWGEEEIACPKPKEVQLAHRIIDAGADLIIGHHPHLIRPFEFYKDKAIFYSLGNFIFPDLNLKTFWDGKYYQRKLIKKQNRRNREGLVVALDENGKLFKTMKSLQKKNIISISEHKAENQSEFLNGNEYADFYSRYYKNTRRKILMKSFMQNPRLPRKGSIKELLTGK
ncbi:MAG: CapA family protein [Bacteroidales bacterium]|nr:CapA family protein [Bacteroidales bacterium]MCF8344721.1 CapA family protein [Bacteroidales bacterium]MCF8350328.1 CapA family protein [Bacteroidales bacterium]MCF8375968.1 CapA family protein [Bacteroidales bacterium]MCF8400456.1 CapA family protein [Bacteroidales bacterium]